MLKSMLYGYYFLIVRLLCCHLPANNIYSFNSNITNSPYLSQPYFIFSNVCPFHNQFLYHNPHHMINPSSSNINPIIKYSNNHQFLYFNNDTTNDPTQKKVIHLHPRPIYTYHLNPENYPVNVCYSINSENISQSVHQTSEIYQNPLTNNNSNFILNNSQNILNIPAESSSNEDFSNQEIKIVLSNLSKWKNLPGIEVGNICFLRKDLKKFTPTSFKLCLSNFFNTNKGRRFESYIILYNIIIRKIVSKFSKDYYNAILFLVFYDFLSFGYTKLQFSKSGILYVGVCRNNMNTEKPITLPFKNLLLEWKHNYKFANGMQIYEKLIELFVEEHSNIPISKNTIGKRFKIFKYQVLYLLKIFLEDE
ncbi:hypothetical protein H312_00516 [Anncaliia algerae PRA339]|uniref:Uncharacterized protein n=1 Tax=Anncaliia algerae PRA339 TaxID=1288291 RepID=A0A059F4X3_9MICR|nr:hypothetical protein H312_00516 [Anncaliia algerae PRA339]